MDIIKPRAPQCELETSPMSLELKSVVHSVSNIHGIMHALHCKPITTIKHLCLCEKKSAKFEPLDM